MNRILLARLKPVAALLALLAVACDDASGSSSGSSASSSGSGSSSSSGSSGTTTSGGTTPAAFEGEPGTLWVSSFATDSVLKIDAATGAVLATYEVGDEPGIIEVGGSSVFLKHHDGSSFVLGRMDAAGKVTNTAVGGPYGLASGAGSVWASLGAIVSRIDPATGQETKKIAMPKVTSVPGPIAFSAQGVFTLASSAIVKIDPATDTASELVDLDVTYADMQPALTHVAAGEGAVWALVYRGSATAGSRVLAKIDPASGAIVKSLDLPINDADDQVAAGGGSVWVTDPEHGRLLVVDPATVAIAREIELGGGAVGSGPAEMTISPTAVWIANYARDRVLRVPFQATAAIPLDIGAGMSDLAFQPK
jgi:DNA-binding beta-propeller fold protein YncE